MNRKERNKKRIGKIKRGQKKHQQINKIFREENEKARLEWENNREKRLAMLSEERKLEPPPRPELAKMLSASNIPSLELIGRFLENAIGPEELEKFFETGIIRVGEVTYLEIPEEDLKDE
jgi:hypothetical protein